MPTLRRARLLASVTCPEEASLAVALGADFVDAKNPEAGALGALPPGVVREIVARVAGHCPVSATIGDTAPSDPRAAIEACRIAEAGVDIVKVGLFPGDDVRAGLASLARLDLGEARLVAVILADRDPDLELVRPLADLGFLGVMLDTAGKSRGSLMDVMSTAKIREFLARARAHGLIAGLAGSLRQSHIPSLLALGPDILGFRGALCADHARAGALSPDAMRAVREAIPRLERPRALAAGRPVLEAS